MVSSIKARWRHPSTQNQQEMATSLDTETAAMETEARAPLASQEATATPGPAPATGPAPQLRATYDIKGCLAGRYQAPGSGGEQTVFKDQNFQEEKLDLGQQRDWFIKQVDR